MIVHKLRKLRHKVLILCISQNSSGRALQQARPRILILPHGYVTRHSLDALSCHLLQTMSFAFVFCSPRSLVLHLPQCCFVKETTSLLPKAIAKSVSIWYRLLNVSIYPLKVGGSLTVLSSSLKHGLRVSTLTCCARLFLLHSTCMEHLSNFNGRGGRHRLVP